MTHESWRDVKDKSEWMSSFFFRLKRSHTKPGSLLKKSSKAWQGKDRQGNDWGKHITFVPSRFAIGRPQTTTRTQGACRKASEDDKRTTIENRIECRMRTDVAGKRVSIYAPFIHHPATPRREASSFGVYFTALLAPTALQLENLLTLKINLNIRRAWNWGRQQATQHEIENEKELPGSSAWVRPWFSTIFHSNLVCNAEKAEGRTTLCGER